MKTRFLFAAAVAASSLALCGCNAFDNDNDEHKSVSDMSLYSGIPSGAIRVAQGYDTVRYRVSEPGRVIIGDDNRRVVVTETTVKAGDEITVDSHGDRVLVNGVPVYQQNLEKKNQHSIFMVPQR